MLYRDLGTPQLSWLEFFVGASYAVSAACILLTVLSVIYFRRRFPLSSAGVADGCIMITGAVRSRS